MATQFNFNGRLVKLPGVYTQVRSGVTNTPLDLSFGNVLVIDSDPNSEFGGGSGINGAIASGPESIYQFDNLRNFRDFIKGGEYWDLAGPLFSPFGAGINGISNLFYVRPLTTTASTATIDLTTSGNGGTFNLRSRNEGVSGNGIIGDAVPATTSFTITSLGSVNDTIAVAINSIPLALYTHNGTDTDAEAATFIVNTINSNFAQGYTASSIGAAVTISSPTAEAVDANSYSVSVSVTGSATITGGSGTMSGGVAGTLLTQGMGFTITPSPTDPTRFVARFFRGNFTGLASDGIPYDGIPATSTSAELLATSDDFNTFGELKMWMDEDIDFNNNFMIVSSSINSTGAVVAADISSYLNVSVFSGATQSLSTSDISRMIEAIAEVDYTFVLAPDSEANFNSNNNQAILSHLVSDARFEKFMVVAGGNDRNTFASQSIAAANSYNSDRVIVVHGGVRVESNALGTGLRDKSSKYKAAAVIGRTAGLEPQTPITFKGLNFSAELHPLTRPEKVRALDNGVLATSFDGDIGAFAILQGVNSLQRNRNVVNLDGTSHSIQLKRIAAQLNKEIEINIKVSLLGNQTVGPNRSTVSPEVVEEWMKAYLQRSTATDTADNLIIGFSDINVEVRQDAYSVSYAFIPNFEVNKIFVTGLIIDPNL